jgi:Tfp pilus assembly protein PilN
MIHVNLSTRPFYNERVVHLVLGVVGLAAGAVFVAGLLQAATLSRERGVLAAVAERDEGAVQAAAAAAEGLRRQIREEDRQRLVEAAGEANSLIERRLFSWTEFFNRIEQTLPAGVMLTSVRPDIAAGDVTVAIGVLGRGVADIDTFIDRLEATGAFTGVLAREESVTDAGTYRTLLVGRYRPGASGAGPGADR